MQKSIKHTAVFILMATAFLMAAACQRKDKTETNRGDLLYASAESAFEDGNGDKACQLLQEALASYRKEGNETGMANSLLALAQVKTDEMQVDTALNYMAHATKLNVGDSLHAAIYAEIGTIHIISGNYRKGVQYMRKAVQTGGKAYYGEDMAVTCGNAAVAYRRLGMPDSARYFLQEGIKAAKQVNDDEDLAFLNNNMATAFAQLGRYDEALEACRNASDAAERAGNATELLNAQVSEAQIILKQGQPAKARAMLEKALPKVDSLGFLPLKIKTLSYMLEACNEIGDAIKVKQYLEQSESLLPKIPDKGLQATSLIVVMVNIKIKNADWQGGLDLLDQVPPEALHDGLYQYDIYLHQKAWCMAGLGNYREAYTLEKRAGSAADTLRVEEAHRQFSELSQQLKAQERETEIARLNKVAAHRQLYITLFAALFAILALLVAFYAYRNKRRKEKELAQKYIEGLERERTRFALELHDGACNELLGIGIDINNNSAPPESVAHRIRQLRESLRQISHELMPPQFEYASLDEVLSHYLNNVKSPDFNVEYSVTGDFNTLPKHLAYELYRITQEAVGNIITHASATKAQVTLVRTGGDITLTVADNGTWSEPDTKTSRGIGRQSTSERAKSIGATLTTEHGADGTVMTLRASAG